MEAHRRVPSIQDMKQGKPGVAAEYVGSNDEGTSPIDGIGQVVRNSFSFYLTGPVTGCRPEGWTLNEELALPAHSSYMPQPSKTDSLPAGWGPYRSQGCCFRATPNTLPIWR